MTNTKLQSLKGFRDFLPEEALKRKWLKDKIVSVFEKWGYDPLETPTLEPLEIFKGQVGEDEKLFFKFQDPGGRDVAMRYDQTVPTCRIVGQYAGKIVFPFRRYQIQSAFRAENPQKGRYREFLQCDADIFGIKSNLADAEVIALSLDIYKTLGFKNFTVLINDRELLKDVPYEAIVSVDKLKKIGEDGVISEMIRKGIPEDQARNYLDTIKNLKPNATIQTIMSYLNSNGFDESQYKFEPTLARSFSYSTGPIWEIEIAGFSGSVLGGERFDNLVKKISGQDIPGTGFAVGFDRTLEAAEQLGLIPQFTTKTQVLITIFDKSLLPASVEAASVLRTADINTEFFPDDGAKLEKQFKYADRKKIPFVVVIGPDEASQNIVKIKNMNTGEETKTQINNLIEIINQG